MVCLCVCVTNLSLVTNLALPVCVCGGGGGGEGHLLLTQLQLSGPCTSHPTLQQLDEEESDVQVFVECAPRYSQRNKNGIQPAPTISGNILYGSEHCRESVV